MEYKSSEVQTGKVIEVTIKDNGMGVEEIAKRFGEKAKEIADSLS